MRSTAQHASPIDSQGTAAARALSRAVSRGELTISLYLAPSGLPPIARMARRAWVVVGFIRDHRRQYITTTHAAAAMQSAEKTSDDRMMLFFVDILKTPTMAARGAAAVSQ